MRWRLTILFVFMSLIPQVFIGQVCFVNSQSALMEQSLLRLNADAGVKVAKFAEIFRSLQAEMRIIQRNYNIRANLPVLMRDRNATGSAATQKAREMLDGQLKALLEVRPEVSDFWLAGADGRLLYSAAPPLRLSPGAVPPAFPGEVFAQSRDRMVISDIFPDRQITGGLAILVAAPITDLENTFAGVAALKINLGKIFTAIQSTTNLGKTSETIVVKKTVSPDGREYALFLSDLRFEPGSALIKKFAIGGPAGIPAQRAALGLDGSGLELDYRGTKTLAAWRPISGLGWGLVEKIDLNEVLSPVRNLKHLILILYLVSGLFSALIGLALANSIAQPLLFLKKWTEIIGQGNLQYLAQSKRTDEIGQLSNAFDSMATNLKNITASRDDLNREIEQRKMAEDGLRTAIKELDSFSYSISHDLRIPLRAMDGFSRILMEDYADKIDSEGKRLLTVIRDNTRKMAQLIEDLLAFARLGKVPICQSEVDMHALAREVVEELKAACPERSIRFELGPLPAGKGDRTLLHQVYLNLVSNAIKFTRRQPDAVIKIGSDDLAGELFFYVKDNGAGFDMQYQDKLFGIFQRLHPQNEFEGTGVGLSLVQRIIHRHGGRVWARGKVDEGAAFYFSLRKELHP
jgi:two-component system sensor kinase